MDIKTLLLTAHSWLDAAGIDHALIGGLALGAHGVQRFTDDVDFLVEGSARAEIKRLFIGRGYKVFFESQEVMQLAGEGEIDFLFANRDISRSMLRNAQPIKGLNVRCVRIEDIIGLKIQAYKNDAKRALRDKADIQALVDGETLTAKSQDFEAYLDWITQSWDLFEKGASKKPKRKPPTLPGKILAEEFMPKLGLSQSALARKLRCTHAKVNEIISGKRRITVAFALQLEKVFTVDADYWLLLQVEYDLWQARHKS